MTTWLQRLAFAVGLSAATKRVSSSGWTEERKLLAREEVRVLWNHGFQHYMDHAFPMDELQPISCQGRGPDWSNPGNYAANDVNGNFSITLVDVLDTFVTLNDPDGFETAVRNVIENVSFNVNTKPQVFETTIRALGGLLSAHLFASDEAMTDQFVVGQQRKRRREQKSFKLGWYRGELLDLAHDLGKRLLPAFETPTGLPYARVNLQSGVPADETTQTCTAGAGSLLLEFTTLSRLTGDDRFEKLAKKAYQAVWDRRTPLSLVGNGIDVITGSWYYPIGGGIGAGIDSFYEYALKMHVLTGEQHYLDIWNEAYSAIMSYSRGADGFWYRAVNAYSGEVSVVHVDSLGAFWAGLQVLTGDIENAIKSHIIYWNLWQRFSGIPETFNFISKDGISNGYPLRPEFIESTYFLYRATKDPFYLSVGERVLRDLVTRAKVPCGLSTVANLLTGEHEDRMESFVLSETLKYLYLLFDEHNPINTLDSNFVFTTEGHVLTLPRHLLRIPNSPETKPPSSQTYPNQCSVHRPILISSIANSSQPDTPPTIGLVGSIDDRTDIDYARYLAGLPIEDSTPYAWHGSSQGRCDAPHTDIYTTSYILGPYGQEVAEDEEPDETKLDRVDEDFMVYDVTGVRLQATTSLDGRGYDITRIGNYIVKRTETVYFADPRLLKTSDHPSTESIAKQMAQIRVPLRFSLDPLRPGELPPPAVQRAWRPSLKTTDTTQPEVPRELTSFGTAANFGDHPGKVVTEEEWEGTSRPRNRFGKGSPALPLVRPPFENRWGCKPFEYVKTNTSRTIDVDDFEYSESEVLDDGVDSPYTPPPPYADTVLLIQRGVCTFYEKLNWAEKAGARGVIVTSDTGVVPSLSAGDAEYQTARMYLKYVGLVVVAGVENVQAIERMIAASEDSEAGLKLMVEVDATPQDEATKTQAEVEPTPKTREDWNALRHQILGRPLYINGKRLHNAVLLF